MSLKTLMYDRSGLMSIIAGIFDFVGGVNFDGLTVDVDAGDIDDDSDADANSEASSPSPSPSPS